jgi:hypothetical protein
MGHNLEPQAEAIRKRFPARAIAEIEPEDNRPASQDTILFDFASLS